MNIQNIKNKLNKIKKNIYFKNGRKKRAIKSIN